MIANVLSYYSLIVQKIYRLALFQVLWFCFTLCGGIILGLFPSTYALLEMSRQTEDLQLKEYIQQYKKHFVYAFKKTNKAGVVYLIMLFLMGMNLFIFNELFIMQMVVLGCMFLILLMILYFLLFFNNELTVIHQWKQSLGNVFLHPKNNLLYVTILIGGYIVSQFSPGLAIFFSVSIATRLIAKISVSTHEEYGNRERILK